MKSDLLHRRTVLKGLGTVMALPWLEAMGLQTGWAAGNTPTKQAAPNRMAILYVPNGVNMDGWRVGNEGSLPSKLPDGRAFAGAGELKKLLLADKEKVVRNLSSKLLTFGLGRGLDYYDGPAVDKITEAALKVDGRFSALVLGVVQSDPFRLRRGTSQVEGGSESSKKK